MNSSLEAVLEGLEMIWAPGAEAVRVRQALGVRSMADMSAALDRAGYEVCHVDLPDAVSGFAKVIEGQPVIVLNRAKSEPHLQFTVAHELAHHILHLGASPGAQPGLPSVGIAEFQAHQFAALWILSLGDNQEREVALNQNPELLFVAAASLLMTAGVILIPLLAHLWSSLVRARHPRPGTGK